MKKLIFISLLCFSLPVFYAQNAVDLTSKESIENWINTHRFKASVEGDFDMYLEIEHLSIGDALVLSTDHGKRKIFEISVIIHEAKWNDYNQPHR